MGTLNEKEAESLEHSRELSRKCFIRLQSSVYVFQ